jgi:hypothetical protein
MGFATYRLTARSGPLTHDELTETSSSLGWIVDAHKGDGRRYIFQSDELLSAFLELEATLLAHRGAPNCTALALLKIETNSDLLANTVDNRRNCRHIHMLGGDVKLNFEQKGCYKQRPNLPESGGSRKPFSQRRIG